MKRYKTAQTRLGKFEEENERTISRALPPGSYGAPPRSPSTALETSSAPATVIGIVNAIGDRIVGSESQRSAHLGDGRLDAIEIRRAVYRR